MDVSVDEFHEFVEGYNNDIFETIKECDAMNLEIGPVLSLYPFFLCVCFLVFLRGSVLFSVNVSKFILNQFAFIFQVLGCLSLQKTKHFKKTH